MFDAEGRKGIYFAAAFSGVSRRADDKSMQIRSDSRSTSKRFGQIIPENVMLSELSALLSFNQGQEMSRSKENEETSLTSLSHPLHSISQTRGKWHLTTSLFTRIKRLLLMSARQPRCECIPNSNTNSPVLLVKFSELRQLAVSSRNVDFIRRYSEPTIFINIFYHEDHYYTNYYIIRILYDIIIRTKYYVRMKLFVLERCHFFAKSLSIRGKYCTASLISIRTLWSICSQNMRIWSKHTINDELFLFYGITRL